MGSFGDRFKIIVGLFWDRFGRILGSFWDIVWTVLGSFWDRFVHLACTFAWHQVIKIFYAELLRFCYFTLFHSILG